MLDREACFPTIFVGPILCWLETSAEVRVRIRVILGKIVGKRLQGTPKNVGWMMRFPFSTWARAHLYQPSVMEGICEIVPPSFRKNTKEKNTYTWLFTKQKCFHHNHHHHHHHHHHHLPRCHFISRKHLLQKLPPKPRKSWSCWTLDSSLCSSQDLYILLSSRWEDYIYLGVYERYMGHSISNHKNGLSESYFLHICIYHDYMCIYHDYMHI